MQKVYKTNACAPVARLSKIKVNISTTHETLFLSVQSGTWVLMVEGKTVKSYKTLTFSQIWHKIAKRILKKKTSQSIKITQHMKIFEACKRQRVTLGKLLNLGLTLVKL